MGGRRERGYTLTELVIVVGILAVIAAVAAPDFSSNDQTKLEVATANVVGAIRFAHSEAIRTSAPWGVRVEQSNQRIRVYRLDTSVSPFVLSYENYDPLTKQIIDLNFSTSAADVVLDSVYIKFKGTWSTTSYLGFAGGSGTPKFNDSGTVRMLDTAYIRLTHNDQSREIRVSPMMARVTVQ